MKNLFSIVLPAVVAVFVAIVAYLTGGETVEMSKAWVAAAFAGAASGIATAVAYAVGKNSGWGNMAVAIAVSIAAALLAAWGMTL